MMTTKTFLLPENHYMILDFSQNFNIVLLLYSVSFQISINIGVDFADMFYLTKCS